MQGEGSSVIFMLPQDWEVKWLAWGQMGIWRQRRHRGCAQSPQEMGGARGDTPVLTFLGALGWCPARGTANWQQGSAGDQQGWKDYEREVATTGWRWVWAPGHPCPRAWQLHCTQCHDTTDQTSSPHPGIWPIPCFSSGESSQHWALHFFGCLPPQSFVRVSLC